MNSYDKTTWVNGGPPAINAAHLNKIEDALAEVIALANDNHVDLDKKAEYVTNATVDNATDTGKVYYTTTDKALIIPVSAEFSQAQFRLARDGKIYARRRSRSSTSVDFPAWGSFADIATGVDPEIVRQIVEAYIAEHWIDLTGVVPQYVIDEAESVLAKAFAHKGLGRTIRFIAVSDSHNDATEASYAYTRVSNQHCGQAVKYIADRIPLDFVAFLGDMTWAGVAHTTAQYQTDWLKEDIQEMNLFLKDGFSGVPNIRVVGNHDQCATTDSGGTVSRLQNSGAYQYFGRYNAGVSDGLSNYGYYDLNNVKVRIIYLNTSDAVNVSSQGTYFGITADQKNWLCETLIDLNTKTDAASWKILLMSHAPLDMISGLAADILIPYTNGGTYGSYTFTNHSAEIIGNCHGHTHCYNVGYISDKIRRFTIPNSNFYDNNHYKNNASYAAWSEETTYPKTQNSRTDTSFSLVTIDLDSLTCYVDNYGAGYDREFSLDYKPAPAPANLFDKDDPDVILRARFNSSMQPVDFADEQLITGFVPASVGTSFTIETDKANNTNGYTGFIMLYNSSKQPIGGLSNATAPFIWSSDYKSGTVTVPQSYINTNFEGTEYARFCLAYVDIGNIEIYNE